MVRAAHVRDDAELRPLLDHRFAAETWSGQRSQNGHVRELGNVARLRNAGEDGAGQVLESRAKPVRIHFSGVTCRSYGVEGFLGQQIEGGTRKALAVVEVVVVCAGQVYISPRVAVRHLQVGRGVLQQHLVRGQPLVASGVVRTVYVVSVDVRSLRVAQKIEDASPLRTLVATRFITSAT